MSNALNCYYIKLMLVWMRARRLSGSSLYGVRSFLIRCAVWGLVAWSVACGVGNVCVSVVVVYLCLRVSLYWGYKSWYLLMYCVLVCPRSSVLSLGEQLATELSRFQTECRV